jgi:hypothetical protein
MSKVVTEPDLSSNRFRLHAVRHNYDDVSDRREAGQVIQQFDAITSPTRVTRLHLVFYRIWQEQESSRAARADNHYCLSAY